MTDKELNDYLEGQSPLSKIYRDGAKTDPPAAVDVAILAEAGKAVRGQKHGGLNPFGSSWFVPASLAAVLVLAVGLLLFMGEEGVTPRSDDGRPAAPAETPMAVGRDAGKADQEITSKQGRMSETKAIGPSKKLRKDLRETTKHIENKGKRERVIDGQPKPKSKLIDQDKATTAEPAAIPKATRPAAKKRGFRSRSTSPGAIQVEDSAVDTDRSKLQRSAAHIKAWLAEIRKLRLAGNHAAADRELRAFKKMYPRYLEPGDLLGPKK